MKKMVAVLLGFVCMAYIVGCGNNSSTTKTIPDSFPTPVSVPTSRTVMGGAIQGVGPLPFTNYSVSTLTGSVAGFSNHSTAVSPPAKFNRPISVTTDGTYLYVADYFNNAIRRIDATGKDITLAGSTLGLAGSTDAFGTAASFNRPSGITTDGLNLYVADSGNFTIRKIVISTGEVTRLAGTVGSSGSFDDPVGTNARFNDLNGITTDGTSLFVTDSNNTIRRIALSDSNHPVTTLAGTPGTSGWADAPPGAQATARFNQPARLTTDGPNLYVTDFGDGTIRKIDLKNGAVSTIAGKSGPSATAGSDVDSTDGTGATARFNQPNGITTDGTNLYVTDTYANTVRKIVLSPGTVFSGPVTTIAGTAGVAGSTDGKTTAVSFNTPMDITTDGTSLYVVDIENHRIRKLQGL